MPNLKNFAKGETLTGNTSDASAITLKAGHGAKFPEPPFQAVYWNATDYPDAGDDPFVEVVQVMSISGDVLTVTRAQEDTVASSKNIAGKRYFIAATLTAGAMSEYLASAPIGGTWRLKDGKYWQIWDQGASVSGWRTMWLVDGQPVYGELDNAPSAEAGSLAFKIKNGVPYIYNVDSQKYQALFATGNTGQSQVTLGPEEDL